MIVQNKGGIGNPNHDEEGKFTTGDGASISGNVSENYKRNYKEDLEENPELSSKVFNLLGVSNIESFLTTLENMEQKSPKTYEKVCDFLDNYIEDNGGKIEFKDLEYMTDEDIEEEIKHRSNFFKNHNMFTDVFDTEKTGISVIDWFGKTFTKAGFHFIAKGKLKNFDAKLFKNKINFVGFSRGLELCFRKFGNLFSKDNKYVFAIDSYIKLDNVGSCGFMPGNKQANILIKCACPVKYQNLYTESVGGYLGANGKTVSYTNISDCSPIVQSGGHEMGHALEHNIIDALFPNNKLLKTDSNFRVDCMEEVAGSFIYETIKSYTDEKGIPFDDGINEIAGSVSAYATESNVEWFAECIGGIVAKKEENYLPAEKHLLKVLQDENLINKFRRKKKFSKYLPKTETDNNKSS